MGFENMPLINDYGLCNQAVTVYHLDADGVTRTVHPRAYLEQGRAGAVGKEGGSGESDFLLVVPGAQRACRPGDKVLPGEGPEVPDGDHARWWRTFIPSKVDGLVVVSHVWCKHWNGRMVHTEAS